VKAVKARPEIQGNKKRARGKHKKFQKHQLYGGNVWRGGETLIWGGGEGGPEKLSLEGRRETKKKPDLRRGPREAASVIRRIIS